MVKPKKHLGQHFLRNEGIARQIAESLSGQGYDQILEIGPGMGVLTRYLLEQPQPLYLVEIDPTSVHYLQRQFDLPSGHLIEADFLRLPLDRIFSGSLAVTGNFPYNISSQIVFKILENRDQVTEMLGMFQKEVADRLVAPPGSKTYGILSVLTAAWYEREYLFTVEPHEFRPPPRVRSAVIRFRRKSADPDCDPRLLFRVVKTAFNQRRKTLRNALKPLNLSPDYTRLPLFDQRAEQLTLEDFVAITNRLTTDGAGN